MSRNGQRQRRLVSPWEIHERIIEHGMPPLDELGGVYREHAEAVFRAQREMVRRSVEPGVTLLDHEPRDGIAHVGVVHSHDGGRETYTRGRLIDPATDRERALAWGSSLLTSLNESVPPKERCRHLRAAGARAFEIRAIAHLGAGMWKCLVCAQTLGRHRQRWPRDCDLCGARPDTFRPIHLPLGGTALYADICTHCFAFWDASTTEASIDEVQRAWIDGERAG